MNNGNRDNTKFKTRPENILFQVKSICKTKK